MTTIYREVEAAALDRWARRNGVTDTDLAEALEISPRAARRTRQGRRPLTATDVQLLAASQNLRPSELIAEFEAVTR